MHTVLVRASGQVWFIIDEQPYPDGTQSITIAELVDGEDNEESGARIEASGQVMFIKDAQTFSANTCS